MCSMKSLEEAVRKEKGWSKEIQNRVVDESRDHGNETVDVPHWGAGVGS